MKKFSIVIFVLVTLFVFSSLLGTASPGNKDPYAMAARQTEMMRVRLRLNYYQTSHVKTINLRYAIEAQTVYKNNFGDFQVIRKKMDALVVAKNMELKKVLDPNQWNTYTKLKSTFSLPQ